ncbi:uncharacterized protein [Euwallacea fornicatus]|uniref:uncharacterized protein isoform X1 n=1 Tax=Euwallacea fornicatus TaxID=995702 RepID=UPI00338FF6E0
MHNIVNWTSGCKVLKRFKRDFIRKIDVSLFFMQVDDIQEGKDHSAAIRPRGFPELVKSTTRQSTRSLKILELNLLIHQFSSFYFRKPVTHSYTSQIILWLLQRLLNDDAFPYK